MICPRCGKEISDTETLCPFCMEIIDQNVEYNDFRKDGFIQIQTKNEEDTSEAINYTPKYFEVNEFQIFIIAFVFILVVSAFTLFSLRFVQKTDPIYLQGHSDTVETYVTETEPETTAPTEPTTKNTVKNLSVKNLIGSWKYEADVETADFAIPYYTFTEDGIAQENYGSMARVGTYEDISSKKNKEVFITIDSSLKGRFTFDVRGNKTDGYTLILTNKATEEVHRLVSATAKTSIIKPNKNAPRDKKLYGYWLTEEEDKSYRFNEDGTMERMTGGTYTNAIWSVDREDVITIKYRKDVLKTVEVEYAFKGESVIINGTQYIKQEEKEEEENEE